VALGSTQPLTEMSTIIFSGGKDGQCVGLTTLPSSCADCLEIWEPQPPGTFRACTGIAMPLCIRLNLFAFTCIIFVLFVLTVYKKIKHCVTI